MLKTRYMRLMMSLLIIAVLASYPVASLQAAQTTAVPSQDVLSAKTVTGSLPGGEFAKIWLAVKPDFPEAQMKVFVEWDRPNAAANGVGFFILDEVGLNRAQAGNSLQNIATASGNPVFEGADNQMEADFKAFGLTIYTGVFFNDSNAGAGFTATVENGTFVDDANQVTDPTAPPAVELAEGEAVEGEAADGETTADTAEATAAEAEVVATEEPAAEVAATTEAVAAETVESVDAAETPAPEIAVSTTPSVVRDDTLEGELTSGETHYLGLVPQEKDGEIQLLLNIDPQDDTDLLRRVNFFVLPTEDLARLNSSTRPSDLAVAAGNRVFGGAQNQRQANFQATGTGEYTVLVNNSSGDKTAQYQLSVENGTLVDDSGQTKTAQALSVSVPSADGEDTADAEPAAAPAASTTTTTTTAAAAPAASSATAGTGDYQPGTTYVVQLNDTLGIIAREAFGNVLFYRQICAFNGITDCNVLEIGDEVKIPTLAQLEALGDNPTPAPASAQPAATATPEAAADEEATTTAEEDTATATESATDEAAVEEEATTAAATDAAEEESASTEDNLLETAKLNDNFNVLVAAVEAAGLENALSGPGPLTIFAPTDAAFALLPSGVLDDLLQDPGGELTNVLLYHIVADKLMAADLADGATVETVQGSLITFNETSSGFNINNEANIVVTDIEASNGVIHVIDGVIQPVGEATTSSATTTSTSTASAATTSTTAAEPTDRQSVIEDLPVLDDASDLSSEQTDEAITVAYQTSVAIREAATFYTDEMEGSGYETTRNVVTAAAGSLSFEKDDVVVQIGITKEGTSNIVTLTVKNQ